MDSSRDTVLVDIPNFSVLSLFILHMNTSLPLTHHRHEPHPLVRLPASVIGFPLVKPSFSCPHG